ncbi:hypothetical protein KC19_10G096500 [Ceratodon purpureus]|uniref:RING-type domain-containing protein n=1 Tax=Ceratodon purpureus TaxID=3225 RepID=A0A8T0GIP4_CERPU|nr:hypothetical protein KC19_10G096500 [Ceratodon purpureus]
MHWSVWWGDQTGKEPMASACGCTHKTAASPRMGATSASRSLEEGLECPVCWESFDERENTPYVLWCGHSLCKTCVLNLEWATVKLSGLPLQLPLFISCPWCQFLTFRFKWKGQLKYPCKNFFLLWVVESLQGENGRLVDPADPEPVAAFGLGSLISPRAGLPGCGLERRQPGGVVRVNAAMPVTGNRWSINRWRRSGGRLATCVLQFTARIPLILLFLFIVVYVLPFSTLVLALYCLITVLFAVPSFLVVYFSYPSLDWLVRAIAS